MAYTNTPLKACYDKAHSLTLLAAPPDKLERYRKGNSSSYFTLSNIQHQAVTAIQGAWLCAANEIMQTLLSKELEAVQAWLEQRTRVIHAKLDNGSALYFDALLLGIVGH